MFQYFWRESLTGKNDKYLKETFPHAKVILHVDAKETITTSYTRLIMANQIFA